MKTAKAKSQAKQALLEQLTALVAGMDLKVTVERKLPVKDRYSVDFEAAEFGGNPHLRELWGTSGRKGLLRTKLEDAGFEPKCRCGCSNISIYFSVTFIQ